MTTHGDYHVFEAGDVPLQSGVVFPSMRLAYKTYGTLNARKDNVIVYPTSFSAQHYDTEWLVQRGGALDPDRYLHRHSKSVRQRSVFLAVQFRTPRRFRPSAITMRSRSSAVCW